MNKKQYIATSLTGATKKVRTLLKQLETCQTELKESKQHLISLAKLSATGPTFFNPFDAWKAEKIRNNILKQLNMNPDGTFIK